MSAIVLLRQEHDSVLLMDIVGAARDWLPAIAVVRDALARSGQSLRCRITQAHAAALSLPGTHHVDLGIEIPCNRWTRGPDATVLRGAWWLTAGDMDFL